MFTQVSPVSVFFRIANQIETGETCVNIQPSDAESVIVIPKRCSRLIIGIVTGIGSARGPEAAIGSYPGVRIAVAFRHYASAVNMRNRADFGHVLSLAVTGVVEREKVLFRKLINPFHRNGLPLAHFES